MKNLFLILLVAILLSNCGLKKESIIFSDNSLYGLKQHSGKVILKPTFSNIFLLDSSGIYKAERNGFWGLLSNDGKEITDFKYSSIGLFHKGYATFNIINNEDYSFDFGYISKKGDKFIYSYIDYGTHNWDIKAPPIEIPDNSHILGNLNYTNFSWTLTSLLNHNLNAFVDEPQIYSDLNNLDKVCIGYGMLISAGNYSEDYMNENSDNWNSFKKNTIYKVIENELLRSLAWNWIKPYYKDAFSRMNPFVKKNYQECFKYLKQHIDSFDKSKYATFLETNEKGFAKVDINGNIDNKRKLSAFVDRLILVHKVISVEDSKRWINKMYNEVKTWK
jgi:hypothetical protein